MLMVSLLAPIVHLKPDITASCAENAQTFSYSYTLENAMKKNHNSTILDESYYDEFLKYSLLVSDKNSLSDEVLALCRMVFETERSDVPNIYCPYARETIKTGTPPKRMQLDEILDDKFFLASMADDTFDFYNNENADLTAYYPDILYQLPESYSVCEYWLDDSGKERIIAAPEYEYGPYYEISYDEEPSVEVLVELETKFNCAGSIHEMDDRTYKIVMELYAMQYRKEIDKEKNTYVSDIWEYEIMHDGSALIIGTTLPVNDEAVLLNEPIILPNELDGHKVYGIDMDTVLCQTGITKIVVPDCYQYVHLQRMESLKELEINSPELSNKLSVIGCPKLESAVLNVKYIGVGAFASCDSLKTVEIKGAEGIDYCSFTDLPALNEVALPDNLRYIGQNAFLNTAVEELVIPKSVEISGAAIPAYESFRSIIIPLIEEPLVIANEDCIIKGYYNTEAHSYALANNHRFVPLDEIEYGDINNDGATSVADAVVLSKWLMGSLDIQLDNWTAADFYKDGKLDVFDLCLLKTELLNER